MLYLNINKGSKETNPSQFPLSNGKEIHNPALTGTKKSTI